MVAEPSTVRVGGLGGDERARNERVRSPRDFEAREYARCPPAEFEAEVLRLLFWGAAVAWGIGAGTGMARAWFCATFARFFGGRESGELNCEVEFIRLRSTDPASNLPGDGSVIDPGGSKAPVTCAAIRVVGCCGGVRKRRRINEEQNDEDCSSS